MRVHLKESGDLRGGDAAAQGLPDRVAGDEGHGQVGEPEEIEIETLSGSNNFMAPIIDA